VAAEGNPVARTVAEIRVAAAPMETRLVEWLRLAHRPSAPVPQRTAAPHSEDPFRIESRTDSPAHS